MIPFGEALRKARLERGLSQGELLLRIRAKFQDDRPHIQTIRALEQHPERQPQDWVRARIVAILTVLR